MNQQGRFSRMPEGASDAELEKAAQVRAMYGMSIFGTVAGTLLALMVGSYYWLAYDTTLAGAWMLYFVLIATARLVVYLSYRRADDIDSNPDSWLLAAGMTMFASGLGWGVAPWLFFGFEPVLTATATTAMGISGLLLLAPSNRVLIAFNLPLFAGLLSALVAEGNIAYWSAAAVLAVLIAVMLVYSRQIQTSIRNAIGVRRENQELAQALEASQAERDQANEKLAREVARRGQFETEVKAANIAAEAANMAKDEFLATMSHEIRTPLNGILPILDILRSTELNEAQRDYLNTAFTSSKHLLTIIDDILDYSKIEAGKLELETVGINLRELLDSVVRMMSGSAQSKGLELKGVIEKDVRLAMRGDPVRLRQVLTNLVSNAIKFTDQGSVTLTISKREDYRSETELLFTVRDTGIGMDKGTADRLFRPFSQANASTTRTYGGTGLGLAICKRLVELMGGRIGVKSQPRRGSVFWFTARLRKSLGDMAGSHKDLNNARTLMCSADPQLRRRFEGMSGGWSLKLTESGSVKDVAKRLKNAAELGETWQFDALIIDAREQAEATIELIQQIRRDPRLTEMGILLLNDDGELPPSLAELGGLASRARNGSEAVIRSALEMLLAGGGAAPAETVSERELAYATDTLAGEGKLDACALLVEDNPVNLHVAQKLLDVIGMRFEVAKNGQIALGLLQAEPERFDAVLMDCMMPVMDGYTATREWRAYEESHGLGRKPIIAMTANAMAGDREKCLQSGMDDYMSKPLNRSLLRNTLAKWLQEGKAQEAAGEVVRHSKPTAPASSAPAAHKPEAVIDPQILDDLVEIMGADFDSLVAVYLEDSPRSLKALARAAEAGKVEDLVGPAHSLKSTSANLGAMSLSELARDMEHDARTGKAPQATQRVAKMVRIYKLVAAELRQLRQQTAH